VDLQIQQIDQRVYDALGIISRQGFKPRLQEGVSIVVAVPLSIGSQNALGFNDSETDSDAALGGAIIQAAVAAQITHCQVMNAAGSGQNVYIDEAALVSPVATTGSSGFYNTALATPGTLVNLRAGGPTPATVTIRSGTNAATLGDFVEQVSFLANEILRIRYDPAIKLTPGSGYVWRHNGVNQELRLTAKLRMYAAA